MQIILSQMAVPATALEQYGLAGVMITTLTGALVYLFKSWTAERKESQASVKSLTDAYRADIKEITTAQNTTTKDVTDKFIALHREQSDDFRKLHEATLNRISGDSGS